ncbi:hypothetical protein GCM10023189_25500 [Nibrella saemangeumensis]|uniref:Uncharacterized protein n=1 Tax=Nibrella saemangeumensis TaxID=1084526 RepID=A0ABP8MXD9_9BACT
MREQRHIIQVISLFLTGLLLLVTGGIVTPNGLAWTDTQPVAKQAVQTKQDNDKANDQSPDFFIKAASLEAVVTTAVSFDFSHVVYLLPPPSVLLMVDQPTLPRLFEVPYFYFSYFRHIFGHHIASNAP